MESSGPLQRIDRKILERATLVGIVMQVALTVAARLVPWIATHAFIFGGMMISAIAGYLYAKDTGKDFASSALAGAIAGGTCGIIGIAAAVMLRETPTGFLLYGTLICILTGAVGGLFGQMAARMKTLI